MNDEQHDRNTDLNLDDIFRSNADARRYYEWYSNPRFVKYPLNTKVDLTLKQRRKSDVHSIPRVLRDQQQPAFNKFRQIQLARLSGVKRLEQDGVPIWDTPTASLSFRDIEVLRHGATVQASRPYRSMRDDRTDSGKWYLTDDECPKLMTRMVRTVNRLMFGNACRRTYDREGVSAVGCMHDKNTRRHFHMMFGRPDHITEEEFADIIDRATEQEPFAYDERVIKALTTPKDVAQVMNYNIDRWKSRTGEPIIFVTHRPPVVADESDAEAPCSESTLLTFMV